MPPLKDILGKPGEGVHFHIPPGPNGIAVMDVIATVLLGCGISWLANAGWLLICLTVVALFVLAEILHLLIGVDTTVARFIKGLFGS